MILAGPFVAFLLAALPQGDAPAANPSVEAKRELVFLAENRPVFVRLEFSGGDRSLDAAWLDSIRAAHKTLDRDGDGKLSTKEADPAVVSALARLAIGGAEPITIGGIDVSPKDEVVSVEELAEAFRPILGPFRLKPLRQAVGRTDALFDHLDRNKDSSLTKPELATISGTLRPLDLDDNDMISAEELEPFNSPTLMAQAQVSNDRKSRLTTLPPVVELIPGESSLRLARLFLKQYDKGKDGLPGKLDNKLSIEEFAIGAETFASADRNSDELLDTDELRKFLAAPAVDFSLQLIFPSDPAERGNIKVIGESSLPSESKVRRLASGDVELAIGQVRLDVRVDNGERLGESVRRIVQQRFKSLDVNKDGYLEGKERDAINAQGSPFAGLVDLIDRDADGKVYLKELADFVDLQTEAARARLVATVADQGRAIFGILDLDKDRRLSARELQRTVDRVTSWDSDGDGMVSADDIPYYLQFNAARAGLPGLTGESAIDANERSASPSVSPVWFQRMDRNHDGDVARREFLGSRDQFDRLDRDKDGLIDANEALAAEVK